MSSTTESALQLFRSLQPVPFHFIGQQMHFLHLVGVQLELLFDYISNTFLIDLKIPSHFLFDRFEFRRILFRMILRIRGVSAVVGLPDRGRSSRLPNSRKREIIRETVRWSMPS